DPRVWEFSEAWLEKYPGSPYAHAANLWLHYAAGVLVVRFGDNQTNWPAARELFYSHMQWALYHADAASRAAPDYIPATDGILRLQRYLHMMPQDAFWDYLDSVMDLTPSYGSLLRASWSIVTETGEGHFDDPVVLQFCERFAARVANKEGYTPEICRADIALEGRQWEPMKNLYEALEKSEHPILQDNKVFIASRNGGTPFDPDLEGYLSESDNADVKAADWYARSRPTATAFLLYEKVYNQAIEQALRELEFDPYNPWHIDHLLRTSHPGMMAIEDPISRQDRWRLLFRKLVVSPYDAWTWRALAHALEKDEHGKDLPKAEWLEIAAPYFSNMIVFGEHSLRVLVDYRWNFLAELNRIDRHLSRKEITPIQAELARDPLQCPYIRLSRLIEFQCIRYQVTNRHECEVMGPTDPLFQRLIDRSARGGECRTERTAPIEDLFYTEQVVEMPRHEDIMSVTIKR
ncbi:MAG: hypothetical protein AAFV38_11280, partial [Pseudomonadota bacterium]